MDQHLTLTATAVTHQVYDALLGATGRRGRADEARDRGAVSLEQVLWFVAAGASVAVIATILWNTIRDEAKKPVNVPTSVDP